MKDFARQASLIVWKDLLTELRTKEIVTSVFIFSLLVIIIFNFAFNPSGGGVGASSAGVLWVAFSFAGILGLSRAFVMEKDKGCLEGLTLCPVSREAIYAGKLVSSFIFMLAVEAITFPVFLALFNVSVSLPGFALVLVLATLGFVAVGTVFSAIAVHTRSREIMLPILFLPVIVPVIIGAVQSSGRLFNARPWSEIDTWVLLIVLFDAIFLAVSAVTFEYVLEQ